MAGTFDPIILVLEGDTLLVGRDQPPIGDCDPVGVARQIPQHFLGSGERLLRVHDPVDLAQRRVSVAGREVHLTPIEYRLLALLVKHAGKVLTHRQLLREVWGPSHVEHSHYLRIYMAQLRHKLEADPARPRYLLTEAGVGYRLIVE